VAEEQLTVRSITLPGGTHSRLYSLAKVSGADRCSGRDRANRDDHHLTLDAFIALLKASAEFISIGKRRHRHQHHHQRNRSHALHTTTPAPSRQRGQAFRGPEVGRGSSVSTAASMCRRNPPICRQPGLARFGGIDSCEGQRFWRRQGRRSGADRAGHRRPSRAQPERHRCALLPFLTSSGRHEAQTADRFHLNYCSVHKSTGLDAGEWSQVFAAQGSARG